MARAEAVGSEVLVLTIDLAVAGARHRDTRNAVVGEPTAWGRIRRGLDIAGHPRWLATVALGGRPLTFGNLEKALPAAHALGAFKDWIGAQFDPSVTWEDVAWVRDHWRGRLVVKGVLDPEDARRVEVLVDGGVRSGLDVVKLGARAVLIGRAWAWAVAARGEAGDSARPRGDGLRDRRRSRPHGHTSLATLDRNALYRPAAPSVSARQPT